MDYSRYLKCRPYSYAFVVGIYIVVSLGYTETYVTCYDCFSYNSPSFNVSFDCFGPDMTGVPTCVGATCGLVSATCHGTYQECEAFDYTRNKTALVYRSCTNNTIESDNCAVLEYTLLTEIACLCKGNLCNAGPNVKAFSKTTLLFLIVSLDVATLFSQ